MAGHTGDATVARGALDDADPVVRELALGALERLGELSPAELAAAFVDTDARVRRRAATVAGTRQGISLMPLLRDTDAAVIETATWACGEQERVADDVLSLLITFAEGADDVLVREAAVAALGAIGDERGKAAIVSACVDKPAVRRRAVLALAPFDGDDVDAALHAALSDRDWQVRQAAEDVLRASQ